MHRLLIATPILFAFHELEEYWTALPWLRQHQSALPKFLRGVIPASADFILIAGVLFFVVFAGVAACIIRNPQSRVFYAVFSVLVFARLENALGHVAQSVVFRGYTPGVLTALLIVLPLSVVVLRDFVKSGAISTRLFAWMIPMGLIAQVLAVALLAWPEFT
ncbi:MAG TPA: HXXEE domain-containing protein [Gemmatimonadaceae bacterium]|nr:HXXEE domain-containing protein [Gemmatimonadaceae bacterium]